MKSKLKQELFSFIEQEKKNPKSMLNESVKNLKKGKASKPIKLPLEKLNTRQVKPLFDTVKDEVPPTLPENCPCETFISQSKERTHGDITKYSIRTVTKIK